MDAKSAIEYIESCTWSETRLGLDRTRTLLERLGDPQKQLRFVHVAGSNGKGSVCAMLDSILRKAGYRVGLYTSPYIQTFYERMKVDGVNIAPERLASITERVAAVADRMEDHPSQFELVTAVAMLYFLEERCDIVVLEVGMGGELDSTNVIDAPEVAVITNIGLEHTEYLGSTLAEIASAKAGIIKRGCDCVCYDAAPEATKVVTERCAALGVPLHKVSGLALRALDCSLEGQSFTYLGRMHKIRLLGTHQLHNAATVLEAVSALQSRGIYITPEAVESGLESAEWPARLEVLQKNPLVLLDGGHNPQCAAALADSLRALLPERRIVFLVGVLADKDYAGIVDSVMPLASEFFCLTPFSPRALEAEKLAEYLRGRGARAQACPNVRSGLDAALSAAHDGGAVVAFGSLYLAGRIRDEYVK